MKYKEWESTPVRYGVYMNRRTGKLAMASPHPEKEHLWCIDKGEKRTTNYIFMKITQPIQWEGTGRFLFNRSLSRYELIDRQYQWEQLRRRLTKPNVKLFSFYASYVVKRNREYTEELSRYNHLD